MVGNDCPESAWLSVSNWHHAQGPHMNILQREGEGGRPQGVHCFVDESLKNLLPLPSQRVHKIFLKFKFHAHVIIKVCLIESLNNNICIMLMYL